MAEEKKSREKKNQPPNTRPNTDVMTDSSDNDSLGWNTDPENPKDVSTARPKCNIKQVAHINPLEVLAAAKNKAASSSKKHTSDINKHKRHETVNALAQFGLQINRLKDAQIAKTIQEPQRARRTRDLETVFTDVIHKEGQKYRICRVCK